MRCPKCGAEINDAAKFCTSCGTPIAQRGRPQRQGYSSPGQQTVRRQTASRAGQQGRAAGSRQAYSQAYSQPYGERQPKKKFPVVPLIALLLVAVVAVQLIFHPFGGGKNRTEEAFNRLCEMTSLGTQSYLYSRILTEQLLETDITTADPAKVNELFDRCLAAWEATGKAAGQMDSMARSVAKMKGLKSIGGAAAKSVRTGTDASGQDAIGETLDAEMSVTRCGQLAYQYSGDVTSCMTRVRELRQVYNGRGTSMAEWNSRVEATAASCTTVVFLSGEVTEGGTTLLNNGEPHSLRTISHDIKRGSLAVQNTDVLVDVGDSGATIVMGSNDTVTVNQSDIADSLPTGDSSVISVNTHPEGANDQTITFHRTSLRAWFILDGVGGFTISRGQKGTSTPVTPPEVPGGCFFPVNTDGEFTEQEINQNFPQNCGFERPEVPNQHIEEWTPPIHHEDIEREIENINNTGSSNTGSTPSTNNPVSESILNEQRTITGAQDGTITVSMLWGTHDDVDLHMDTPDGSHIYYSNKTAGGGTLDVDMNASSLVDNPIENIFFPDPAEGHYKVYIRDYRDRTPDISTHYLVRVNVAGEERVFEGDIDATGTEIVIFEFDYVRPANQQPTTPPLTEESMNERLSNANAGVGDITVSLAWDSWDDVDLHMNTPAGGHIYYRNKNADGGTLDVDRNAGSERVLDPVENIYFAVPQNGHYKVWLNEYSDRTDGTTHYIVRVKIGDQTQTFEGTIDGTGTDIPILEFDYGGAREYPEETFQGHRYRFYADLENPMTWSQARDICIGAGGHLVTITSAEEMQYLANLMNDYFARFPEDKERFCRPWIGGYGMTGLWNWVTGEPFEYSNFAPGKPDNNGQDEFFLHICNDSYQWNDLNNGDTLEHLHRGFICEFDSLADLDEGSLDQSLSEAGAMSGDITISMLWDSEDDFDLHVFTPDGTEIYYSNPAAAGGELDVDANSDSDNLSSSPVENIYFADPVPGQYWVYVNNYEDRTPDSAGNYLVRVTVGNESRTYTGSLADEDETVEVMGFQYNGVQRQS